MDGGRRGDLWKEFDPETKAGTGDRGPGTSDGGMMSTWLAMTFSLRGGHVVDAVVIGHSGGV